MAKVARPWSLLSSHGLILVTVSRYPNLTVVGIADKVRLNRATVLRVLRDLRTIGMLDVRRVGRRNAYAVNKDASFRHPVLRDARIEGLLQAFADGDAGPT
jgi:predicted transcriptional regulator